MLCGLTGWRPFKKAEAFDQVALWPGGGNFQPQALALGPHFLRDTFELTHHVLTRECISDAPRYHNTFLSTCARDTEQTSISDHSPPTSSTSTEPFEKRTRTHSNIPLNTAELAQTIAAICCPSYHQNRQHGILLREFVQFGTSR